MTSLRFATVSALAAVLASATLLIARDARAYVVQTTSGGDEVHWRYMPQDFLIDTHGYSQITDGTLLQAEEDSFSPWEVVDQCDAKYNVKTSSHGVSDVFDNNAPVRDRLNELTFVEDDWAGRNLDSSLIALTFTYFSDVSGKILEDDIVANAVDYQWSDGDANVKTDVRNFLTHEVGHSYGLGHNQNDTEATMYPTGTQGETKKRDLDADDIAGIQHLYKPGCCKHTKTGDFLALFGCDASAGAGRDAAPWTWLAGIAAVAAAVILRRRTRAARRGAAVVGVVAVLAIAQSARATIAVQRTLPQLSTQAELVVHGTVVYTAPLTTPRGSILTLTQVEVDQAWKGATPEVLTLVELGGVSPDGDEAMHVEGAPSYRVGDEVVVFATPLQGGLARLFPDGYRTAGFAQGDFRVVHAPGAPARVVRDLGGLARVAITDHGYEPVAGDDLSGVTLDDLRRAVKHAAAQTP